MNRTVLLFASMATEFVRERMRLDFLWAALCMMAAVFFVFRGSTVSH